MSAEGRSRPAFFRFWRGFSTRNPGAIVSVDTYKAATARAALAAGAEIINDVSGLAWDPEMAAVCGGLTPGVVLMHTRGRPEDWRSQPQLAPVELLAQRAGGLGSAVWWSPRMQGFPLESIVLDPGYGFGKRFGENYTLLARQAELLSMRRSAPGRGEPQVLFGAHTGPAFWGKRRAPRDRDTASIAAMVAALLRGASIVRVHAARLAVEAAQIADAVLAADNS